MVKLERYDNFFQGHLEITQDFDKYFGKEQWSFSLYGYVLGFGI